MIKTKLITLLLVSLRVLPQILSHSAMDQTSHTPQRLSSRELERDTVVAVHLHEQSKEMEKFNAQTYHQIKHNPYM